MGERSHSIKLGRSIVKHLLLKYPESQIVERDLVNDGPPYLNNLCISASLKNDDDRNNDEKERLAYSDAVLREIKDADIIVLGAPMYNFGLHAVLKAFIDQVVRFGHTIQYQEDGSRVGLLAGKVVYLAITAGGSYQNSEFDPVNDYIVSYLHTILNYVGIDHIIPLIIEGTSKPDFAINYDLVCEAI